MTAQLLAQLVLVQVRPPSLTAQKTGYRTLDALPEILVGGLCVYVGHALAPELIESALRFDLADDFVDKRTVAGHMLEVVHRGLVCRSHRDAGTQFFWKVTELGNLFCGLVGWLLMR